VSAAEPSKKLNANSVNDSEKKLSKNGFAGYSEQLEKHIAGLKSGDQGLDAFVTNVRQLLAAVEEERTGLEDEINRVYNSRGWRFIDVLRKTRSLLSGNDEIGLKKKIRKTAFGRVIYRLLMHYRSLKTKIRALPYSKANINLLNQMAQKRGEILLSERHIRLNGPFQAPVNIDITAVVYNNSHWLETYIASLVKQDYPLEKINLFFVDNGSTDDSFSVLCAVKDKYHQYFHSLQVIQSQNVGFGAGHDRAVRAGTSPFIMVSNIDIEFETDAIVNMVHFAQTDTQNTASWEFRQKPYEHPKYYDPVTLEVSWSSHACVLVRRSAYEKTGGYDKNIFMYGEDVELSYRFRDNGYLLKYVPWAVVWHYTYETARQIKPVQFSGSVRASAWIRFRYGSMADKLMVFPLQLLLTIKGAGFKGSRKTVVTNQIEILKKTPKFWEKRKGNNRFPFYGFDYEMTRYGSFYPAGKMPDKRPKVSVLTRTYRGRESLLRECIASVMNQTWPEIEHVIVEDGGDTLKPLVQEVQGRYPGRCLVYRDLPKKGRAFAGNACMAMASGDYFLILDDDDLLFADHVETLAHALAENQGIDAAYSLAWEVETLFDDHGGYRECNHYTDRLFFQEFDRNLLMNHNYIPIQSILFKRELYERHGGFDLEMDLLEDWNLWTRYGLTSTFRFVPKTTSMYRTPHDMEVRLKRKKILDRAYPDALKRQKRAIAQYGMKPEEK
jgi:GT2 family glycosyltransferase